jgi:hypothetical protein
LASRCDRRENGIRVIEDVAVGEADHVVAVACQVIRSVLIVGRLIRMYLAVELDDQTKLRATEVEDESADWVLPTPFQAADRRRAEHVPEYAFRRSWPMSHLARARLHDRQRTPNPAAR